MGEGWRKSRTGFAIKCSHLADWSTTIGYSNQYMLHFAIRSHGGADQYKKLFPFGQGWGAGPVSPKLWKEWQAAEPNDPESIMLDGSKTEGYIYGADKQMEETGLWQKKLLQQPVLRNIMLMVQLKHSSIALLLQLITTETGQMTTSNLVMKSI